MTRGQCGGDVKRQETLCDATRREEEEVKIRAGLNSSRALRGGVQEIREHHKIKAELTQCKSISVYYRLFFNQIYYFSD